MRSSEYSRSGQLGTSHGPHALDGCNFAKSLTMLNFDTTRRWAESSSINKIVLLCISQIEASTCPPSISWAFDTFTVPGRREFDYESPPGGGEFELHPRFHVKYLAWQAIMGDAVLEDFRGKDCAFVANWLWGKGLNKLSAVFEVFKF